MRLALSNVLATALLIAFISCSGDDSDGGDDADDDSSDGGDAGDDAGDDDVSDDDASDDGDDGGDDGAPGDNDGGTSIILCGGLAGLPCEDTHYCDWPDGSCGAGDGTGECKPRPDDCEPDVQEVCGCDGERHDNACAAAMAGTDESASTTCFDPAP